MAKFVFCLLLVTAALVKAEDECVCKEYTEEEMQEIWEVMSKLSAEQSQEEGILPGVLSPLTPCGNCLDRRKRTIIPQKDSETMDVWDDDVSAIQDPRCPVGYGRIAFRCVRMDSLLK